MTLATIAREFADSFITKQRDNGETFYCLKDGAPEWMSDAIMAAHDGGEMLPNDWSYRLCSAMAEHIAETLEYDSDADLGDAVLKGSDSLVPHGNYDRAQWLASHLYRVSFVDDAVLEYGQPEGGVMAAIGFGMARELEMIGRALVEAIEEQAEEDEDA